MSVTESHESHFRRVGHKQRVKEDGRFIRGQGRFVADVVLPGMLHVALVSSPYAKARIVGRDDKEALALDGVVTVLWGDELAANSNPLANALHTPGVRCFSLAHEEVRYAGEWVAAVVATSRRVAEDAVELIDVDYAPETPVLDSEAALLPDSAPVHAAHGSNVLYHHTFTWGPVDDDFAAAAHSLEFDVVWGRSATVPLETFGVVARWHEADELLDVWASIQMPSYAEQIAGALGLSQTVVRAHYDIDVGGSYGVKRGIKHSVLAGYLARKLRRPVRLIEDRLENMAGGDAHGPDRRFHAAIAYDGDGTIRAMRLRALEDVGGHTGRAPFQLGKPIGAIVGPYRIHSVEYEAICVTTNKTGQTAVRGFGQAPTNVVLEMAVDKVARSLGLDRHAVRRHNFIGADEFPYEIPSGSKYDSGDYHTVLGKAEALIDLPALVAERDALRQKGLLAGIGIATCLEPGGGNSAFEPLINPKNETTTWPESCRIVVARDGMVTAMIATSTSGQGHETLAATVIAEELDMAVEDIRVVHSDTLSGLPGNTPVASRMAIMLGGAATGAARMIRDRALLIAAGRLDSEPEALELRDGYAQRKDDPSQRLAWEEIAFIAHRYYHLMPPGAEPGLQASYVWEVPLGPSLPDENGRVQMYPCYSFAAHIVLATVDPDTGHVKLPRYAIAHDCGTVINPDIVKGMVLGGTAHGIGAALYERFTYDDDGQLVSGSFADYLLPSAHEVPDIQLTEHCTPSPLTSHGQKGVGEGGYLAAPAAVTSAVNDALAERGREILNLPMRPVDIEHVLYGEEA